MRIIIEYPKLVNLYSFLSNLSQWNDLVCVPERKKEWLKITGKLTEEEIGALDDFSKIFQGSEFNIENIFLYGNPKNAWSDLTRRIGRQKTNNLKNIFSIFEKRFNIIWKRDLSKLKIIKKEFAKQRGQFNKNLDIIKNLCGLTKNQSNIDIIVRLILSSNIKEESQGFAHKNVIILECSGWPINKINYLINNILLHESFHILLKQNKKLYKEFEALIYKNRSTLDNSIMETWGPGIIFEEALISSFIPEGYLTEKISGQNIVREAQNKIKSRKITDLEKIRYQSALNNYNIVKEYINKKLVLDKQFLNNIINDVSKNTK